MTTVVTEVRGVEGSQCTQMESGSTNEAISVPPTAPYMDSVH